MARWIFANMTFKFGQLIVYNLHRNSNPEPALIGLCYVYIYIYTTAERENFWIMLMGGGMHLNFSHNVLKNWFTFQIIIKIFLIRIPILFGSKKSIWNTRNKKKKYPSFGKIPQLLLPSILIFQQLSTLQISYVYTL